MLVLENTVPVLAAVSIAKHLPNIKRMYGFIVRRPPNGRLHADKKLLEGAREKAMKEGGEGGRVCSKKQSVIKHLGRVHARH